MGMKCVGKDSDATVVCTFNQHGNVTKQMTVVITRMRLIVLALRTNVPVTKMKIVLAAQAINVTAMKAEITSTFSI